MASSFTPPLPSPHRFTQMCLAWIGRRHRCHAAQIAIQGAEVHLLVPGEVSEVRGSNPGESGNPKGEPATRSGTQVAQVPQGIEGIEGLQCFIFIQRWLELECSWNFAWLLYFGTCGNQLLHEWI